MLIEHSAKVNAQPWDGLTPLVNTLDDAKSHRKVAVLLREHGSNSEGDDDDENGSD